MVKEHVRKIKIFSDSYGAIFIDVNTDSFT